MKNLIIVMAVTLGLCSAGVVYAAPRGGDRDKKPAIHQQGYPDMDDEDEDGPRPGMFPGGPGMDDDEDGPRAFRGKGDRNMDGKGKKGGAMKARMGKILGHDGMQRMEGEFLDQVAKLDKDFAGELKSLKGDNVAVYRRVSMRLGKAMFIGARMGDEEMPKTAIALAKAEIAGFRLTEKYKAASESDKKALKEQLRANLSQEFDLRQTMEESRVKVVEKELAELKKEVGERKSGKAEMINDRLKEMLGEKSRW